MRILPALLALSLAACSAPEEAPPAPADPAPAMAEPVVVTAEPIVVAPEPEAAPNLTGKWSVAQVVGADPDPGTPVIQVSVTGDRFQAQSQCKHYWWTYTLSGNAFDATHAPYPHAICERTDSYWEQFFVEAIERANVAVRRPDGAVLLTGPGGQVLLRPKG